MKAREFWRFWWRWIAGIGMWVGLAFCVSQRGPAWSAHLGHGQRGTWTVTRVACGKGGCHDVGRFVSSDGADVRATVNLSGGSSLTVGQSTPALDTDGDSVYPPGGGHAWIAYVAWSAALILLCAVWLWTFPLAVLRRRRAHTESSGTVSATARKASGARNPSP